MSEAKSSAVADFAQLPIPVRSLEGSKLCRYRVYTSLTKFALVEAETAADAMKLSGVEDPIRIHREVPGREVLVHRKRLME